MLALRSIRVARRQWAIRSCRYSTTSARGPFNVLFCGSDEFSIASLRAVLDAKDVWRSVHVVTPAPQRTGRGGSRSKNKREEHKSVLQVFAEELGLSTSSWPAGRPKSRTASPPSPAIASPTAGSELATWTPMPPFDTYDDSNLLLTASFGHIIPNSLLDKFNPAHRLNVHPSLLPKYRGAAPLQWAILNGDESLGISVQRLVEKGKGIDAGEVIGTKEGIAISPSATFPDLIAQTAPLGGELLVRCLREIMAGTSTARQQDETQKTRAPKIGKETSRIVWTNHSAGEIARMHRALHYHHPIWTTVDGKTIQLLDAEPTTAADAPPSVRARIEANKGAGPEGTAWLDDKGQRIWVWCPPIDRESGARVSDDLAASWLQVTRVKPEGKKEMAAKDWWNGLGAEVRKRGWVRLGD